MARDVAMALFAFAVAGAVAGASAHAQTFTTLANFDETNGANPSHGSLAQGVDGSLYGTT